MVTKLKNLLLTSVDLVRRGANQEADICLAKSAEEPETVEKDYATFDQITDGRDKQEKLWQYTSALTESLCSIKDDHDLDSQAKERMMRQSLQQFAAAMDALIGDLCAPIPHRDPTPMVAKEDLSRFDHIVEIEKFNDKHDPKTGRFAPKNGGGVSGGAAAVSGGGKYKEVGGQEMHAAFTKAYDTMTDEVRWRVGTDYGPDDYEHAKCLVTEGGSTIAIKPDGDIVSVCKAAGDPVRAKDMLKTAVENGGTKLDAFGEKLYNLYTRNGFEPVSQCKFVDEYAPDAWIRANGFTPGDTSWFGTPNEKLTVPREDITFFKYTGNKTTMSYEQFHKNTKLHDDYGEAQGIRDGGMKNG